QNQFAMENLLNASQLEEMKTLRNVVIQKILTRTHSQASFKAALDGCRPSLQAELERPVRWNQESGMRYLDLEDVRGWAKFVSRVFRELDAALVRKRRNLSDLAGSMEPDPEFDKIIAEM